MGHCTNEMFSTACLRYSPIRVVGGRGEYLFRQSELDLGQFLVGIAHQVGKEVRKVLGVNAIQVMDGNQRGCDTVGWISLHFIVISCEKYHKVFITMVLPCI